jgi:hypothetical protein
MSLEGKMESSEGNASGELESFQRTCVGSQWDVCVKISGDFNIPVGLKPERFSL